jgi:exo-beta-1,3-glucanase (GH17 family)
MTASGGTTAQGGTSSSGGQTSQAGTVSGGGGAAQAGSSAGGAAGSGGTTDPNAGSGGAAAGTAGAGGTIAAGGMAGAGGSGGMLVIPPFTGRLPVIDYSPYRDGQAPGGNQPTEAQVREDLELLQQFADGVRIYGTDGGNSYVPALCDELGLNLHIGAWIDGLASDGPNVDALMTIVNQEHPSIKTAVIGNEVLNRAMTNMLTEEDLIAFVTQARTQLTATGVNIAVAETYPRWMEMRPNLAASVDMIIWHTYGWWSGADINAAAALIYSRYQDMLTNYPNKPMVLGETGWPSMYDHMSMDMTTTAVGSEENQWRYYDEVLGILQMDGLEAWPFAAFDENWKGTSGEGMVGAHWGIFNEDRTPKMAATQLMAIAAAN